MLSLNEEARQGEIKGQIFGKSLLSLHLLGFYTPYSEEVVALHWPLGLCFH